MQDESRFSREEKEKAARLWTLTAFDVVPGAGIEPARLAAGDFESPASTNFTTRALERTTNIMALIFHQTDLL